MNDAPAPADINALFDLVTDDTAARVAWSFIAEPGDRLAHDLVAERGPVRALNWLVENADPTRPATAPGGEWGRTTSIDSTALTLGLGRWVPRLVGLAPRVRDILDSSSIEVIVPGSDDWPEYPADRVARPFCLYARGDTSLLRGPRRITVVGARAATDYGETVTKDLTDHLVVDHGATVISGGAFGIDCAATAQALASGSRPVIMSACGVDRAHPSTHADLFAQVASRGLLVSELPPGTTPTRNRFIARNRLMAALSDAVVVTEAGRRSGALVTARAAYDMGVPVCAVPGPVTSAASAGAHTLIRDRIAHLVSGADDVMALVSPREAA